MRNGAEFSGFVEKIFADVWGDWGRIILQVVLEPPGRSGVGRTAHKKKRHFADFSHKSTTGSTSTCVFFYNTTFRRSATTSATRLFPKSTTRRWTLRWSNYSVAKRQQFSYTLSTATLSSEFENVVPVGWI